jgi:hypothetical protein
VETVVRRRDDEPDAPPMGRPSQIIRLHPELIAEQTNV